MRILRWVLVGLVGLLVLVVGGLAAAAWLVDVDGLIEQYKPQALEAASTALGREVELGSVSPTWFPTLGLRATEIAISDTPLDTAADDSPDFVDLDAIEVGIAVWPALVSLGKDIEVSVVRLEGPKIRVVRFEDGGFNFSDIGASAETTEEETTETSDGGFADRLSSAKVGTIAITNGVVVYEDRAPGGIGTVEVRKIGFEANEVGLGLPIDATLTAALGGATVTTPNLELRLVTGPLASAVSELGAPEVEEITLDAKALPLSVVPMKVQGVLLDKARLSSEIRVETGEKGQLTVTGPLSVSGLRLTQAGAPAAREPLDVALQLSVKTSTTFSRFGLGGTKVSVGPLGLDVAGSVATAPAVSWKAVELSTTEAFSVQKLVKILPGEPIEVPAGRLGIELASSGGLQTAKTTLKLMWMGLEYAAAGTTAKGAVRLDVDAKGALAQPTVEVRLDLGALDVVGEGFAKPEGLPAELETKVVVAATEIDVPDIAIRLGDAWMKGRASYPLGTGEIRASMALEELALKPLLSRLQIPADQLPEGSKLAFDLSYAADAANPAQGRVKIPNLSYAAGKSRLNGQVDVASLDPVTVSVVGRSPYLDLDQLIPASSEGASGGTEAPTGEESPSEAPIISESMRSMTVTTKLEVEKLIYGGVEMSDVDVRLALRDGKLAVQATRIGVFGGKILADGTTIDLTKAPMKYDLAVQLAGLRGESLLAQMFDLGDAVTGKLESKMTLSGQGFSMADLGRTLDGSFSMAMLNGKLEGVNLAAEIVKPLQGAISFAQSSGKLSFMDDLNTSFSRLAGQLEVNAGKIALKTPLELNTDQGKVSFTGSMGIDGKLGLKGTFAVPPKLLRQLTAGKVKPKEALPVSFGLGCTVTKPCVEGVDVAPAAKALTAMAAGKAVDLAVDALEKQTGADLSKAKDAAKKALEDAEATKKQLEAEAQAKLDEAKAKAEAEAKAAAEEVKRKAEAEAEAARKRAEAEAKAAADAAKKKAEEEAKKGLKGLFGR